MFKNSHCFVIFIIWPLWRPRGISQLVCGFYYDTQDTGCNIHIGAKLYSLGRAKVFSSIATNFGLKTKKHRAILHLFEYTTPVLSLWYSRCSDMQRHRAILHLFEYTTPVLSLWYIWCSNMQWHRRYCTFLNTQHQFCPFDISDAAICNISNFQRGFQFQTGDSFYKWWFYYFKLGFELFQTVVWIISNWCLKIRLHFSGLLHIKALNLGIKV